MVKVAQQWTEHEFAGLDLGDARLDSLADMARWGHISD